MDEIFREIAQLIDLGRAAASKGNYTWAIVHYVKAAAMGETLAKLKMNGDLKMDKEQVLHLQELMEHARDAAESARLKLGNGNPKPLSGTRNRELADIAAWVVADLDDVFFS